MLCINIVILPIQIEEKKWLNMEIIIFFHFEWQLYIFEHWNNIGYNRSVQPFADLVKWDACDSFWLKITNDISVYIFVIPV